MRIYLSIFLIFISNTVFADQYRIGVLAFRGNLAAMDRWQATANYLSEKIPGHSFKIVPLNLEKMRAAVSIGAIDFAITNTGQYVELEVFYGISRIATRKNSVKGKSHMQFSAVIFVRTDRADLQTINDLKGKSLMGVKETGFGGFRMAWRELLRHGLNPYTDLSQLSFSGFPQSAVVYAVRDGKVDAGTFRSESLERMAMQGKILLKDYRVLNQQPMTEYPMLHSTSLYPSWPFAKLKHIPAELAEQVAGALFQLSRNHVAAKKAHIQGWTIPLNYQPVHDLLRELQVGPYHRIGQVTLEDFIKKYGVWLSLLTGALVVLMVLTIFLVRVNRSRKKAELELRQYQEQLVDLVHNRTEDIVKIRDQAITASEAKNVFLSTMSHELRTPLNAIIGYSEIVLEDLGFDKDSNKEQVQELYKVHGAAMHLLNIINKIMDVSKIEDGSARVKIETFSLKEVLDEVVSTVKPLALENNNKLRIDNHLESENIQADMLRLEEILIHILENACKFTRNGNIMFTIMADRVGDEDWVEFVITDDGIGMTEDQKSKIFEVFTQGDGSSTRRHGGIGAGLVISRGYCRIMGGDIYFTSKYKIGSEFTIRIPTLFTRSVSKIGAA